MFLFYLSIFLITTFNRSDKISAQLLEDATVTIDIPQGTLKGRSLTTVTGVPYYSFQGIPYAQPPVGELRFKAPQPPLPWEGVRDATKEGDKCPQASTVDSPNEDCLFLNVYTTQLPSDTESPSQSVMFWIHGGGFIDGSGNSDLFGPDFLIDKGDIILVTMNYRLGLLGFFGLDHPEVSKNNGLKDQVAALQWVRDNIDKFGGNPDDVTIFGESAGGASVHYLLLSPLSKGLFHKAISQSGAALDTFAFVEPDTAHENALAAGHILSANASDLSEILESFMTANATELFILSSVRSFVPTKEDGDDAFLSESPLNIIKSGKFNQVPYITGVNSAEGKLFISPDILQNSSLLQYYDENFEQLYVPEDLNLQEGSPESLQAAAEIKETYFGNYSISEDTFPQLVDLIGDTSIVDGVRRTIYLQLKTGSSPIYFYLFSYLGNFSKSVVNELNFTFPGAAHSDELGYLFQRYNFTVDEDSTEAKTRLRMTTLWTNFAKTGFPSLEEDISWKPLNEESRVFLNIDAELTIEDYDKFKSEKTALWADLYKNIDKL